MINPASGVFENQTPFIVPHVDNGKGGTVVTPIMSAANWHYIHITLIYVKRYMRITGETPIICQRLRHVPNLGTWTGLSGTSATFFGRKVRSEKTGPLNWPSGSAVPSPERRSFWGG